MWKELQQKIYERNANGSPARIEWYSDGKNGEGKLTEMKVTEDYVEFFITDNRPEVGYFTLRSARSVLGIIPMDGKNIHIFSHYMGTITIFLNE